MASAWARDRAHSFYLLAGLLSLGAVLIGFSTTYLLPMARRSLSVPATVHLHGALSFAWVLLFIVQCWLVKQQRTPLHRRLGQFGLPLAIGILASGVATGLWATGRDLPRFGEEAYGGLTGTVTSLTLFTILVAAAVTLRRRPDWHKRLLLLATVVVLWPAWFRWRHLLPFVPRPEILLALIVADLPILVAAVRDRIVYGRVHPAWLWVGSAVFVEQCVELWLFGSPAWNAAGKLLFDLLR